MKSFATIAEAVQAAQASVELSVKAAMLYLGIETPKVHGLDPKQLQALAAQCRSRNLLEKLHRLNLHHTVNLPRLLVLLNFWAEFYLLAKYGMEAGNLANWRAIWRVLRPSRCSRRMSAKSSTVRIPTPYGRDVPAVGRVWHQWTGIRC